MWKDSETELDYLDFDYLICILNSVLRDDSLLPSTIGLYGDWGSGKSSLLRMSKIDIEKEKGTCCLFFNGWLFEGYEDAKTAILGSVLDSIKEHRKLSQKAKLCFDGLMASVDKFKIAMKGIKYGASFIMSGVDPTLSTLTMENIIAKGLGSIGDVSEDQIDKIRQGIADELDNTRLRENIREFQKEFEHLLKMTKISRLVVYIDELDRCSPDTILYTLEAIRLFLFKGNVAFVIGADERHIQYAVKRKFSEIQGIEYDVGKEYLEKLIQYPIKIPRLDAREVEYYIACLFLEKALNKQDFEKLIGSMRGKKQKEFDTFELDYDFVEEILPNLPDDNAVKEGLTVAKQLSTVLAVGLFGNPRQCKRFLNSLIMREEMAKAKAITLNRGILAKIMMMEHFRTNEYIKLSQINAEGALKEMIMKIESQGLDGSDFSKDWKNDKWLCAWIENEPHLSGVDLRPYFYFTRDSLTIRYSSNIKKLSSQALDVLKRLTSKSEALVNAATQEVKALSDHEASEVLKAVFAQMMNEDSIDGINLMAFVRIASYRESLIGETLYLLKGIPKSKIRLSHIVRFKEFGTLCNQQLEIMRWLKSLNVDDERIKREIDKED